MATPTDDDNADGCISGNYYGYERGGTLGRYNVCRKRFVERKCLGWQYNPQEGHLSKI